MTQDFSFKKSTRYSSLITRYLQTLEEAKWSLSCLVVQNKVNFQGKKYTWKSRMSPSDDALHCQRFHFEEKGDHCTVIVHDMLLLLWCSFSRYSGLSTLYTNYISAFLIHYRISFHKSYALCRFRKGYVVGNLSNEQE